MVLSSKTYSQLPCMAKYMCSFVVYTKNPNSAFSPTTRFMSTRIITDGYDEFEIRKMNKTGIMLFFKNQIQLKESQIQLKESQIQLKEKLIENQIQLKEKEIQLKEKDVLLIEKGVELKDLKYTVLNTKYLKLKGNLNLRGLIEEYERSDLFRQCRKRLAYKVTVIDEESKMAHVEFRKPNRKTLWDEAMKEKEYSSLLTCIENSNPDRRDTVGERVRDLYNSVSKEVHKPGNSDAVLISSNQLFDHEVRILISSILMRYDC